MNRRTAVVTTVLAVIVTGIVLAGILFMSGSSNSPNVNGAPTPSPTDVKVEVERAYLAHWDAYAEALLTLDPAPLEKSMTGEALEKTKEVVAQQRQENQPVRVRVEHNYRIAIVRNDFASVDDTFIDHSVRLDANTKDPVEEDPKKTVRNSYTLRKVGGRWKVAEIIGYEGSPSQ